MTPEVAYLISLSLVIFEKLVCFILGFLTIRLGHQLIASGVKGEFKFSAKLAGVKADLASVSPGLLFVLLGVLLIGFAINVDKGAKLHKKGQSGSDKPDPLILQEFQPTNHEKDNTNENQ